LRNTRARGLARLAPLTLRRQRHFVPTPTGLSTTMSVVNPFVLREPLQEAGQALPAVDNSDGKGRTLLSAIRSFEHAPFRIISHECEDGKVFNCAFFDDANTMAEYNKWFISNALTTGGVYHEQLSTAFKQPADMPTPETWLWGSGFEVLSDTRFGEYQLGMAVRYSRMVFRDDALLKEAQREALTAEFEQRIAKGMHDADISYFGRLVMSGDGHNEWISASRYGSVDDAHRGTAAVKTLMAPELDKWFSSYDSVIGRAVRVLEI